MSAPGRLTLRGTANRLEIQLPAHLTPILELGWLVVAAALFAALLPAAITQSALAGVAGLVGVAVVTGLLVRSMMRRYAATLILTPAALTVAYNNTRRAVAWADIEHIGAGRIGPIHLPPLDGLHLEEQAWLEEVLYAFRQQQLEPVVVRAPGILELLQLSRQPAD